MKPNIAAIKLWNWKLRWQLRSVYVVTEMRDNCVYKTKLIGYVVCGPDYKIPGATLNSVSTSITTAINSK